MPGDLGSAETTMSEHHKHTEFLKHCLSYDDNSGRDDLHDKLSRIQHELSIVQRAIWLLLLVIVLSAVGLVCPELLLKEISYGAQQFIVKFFYALILASLISVVAFGGLWIHFRVKLHRRREECRQLITQLLADRLGNSSSDPMMPGQMEKTER